MHPLILAGRPDPPILQISKSSVAPDPPIPKSFKSSVGPRSPDPPNPRSAPDPQIPQILGPLEFGGTRSRADDSSPVPALASVNVLREFKYNLSATGMRNINLKIGALHEVILEAYGLSVDLPLIIRGNMYREPGDPPSMRRLPNSQTGFENAYNRMMRSVRQNNLNISRSSNTGRNNSYSTLINHLDNKDKGINLNHLGALRYVIQNAKYWDVHDKQI
ncbi:hypothetical protein T492DRAFT_840685 [Pavlovales sp. CCMP2436]|nr:hypothetical protein T492DRAFT_840685 [Pavlovales sp. CCMP2436]